MSLKDTLALCSLTAAGKHIKAGGPGSGRHAGFGTGTNAHFDDIAKRHMGIDTGLAPKGRDRHDFHDVAVWGIKGGLNEAYRAGSGNKDASDSHLESLAQKHLGVESLKTQNSDDKDFHQLHVNNVKSVLTEAYQSGTKQSGTAYSRTLGKNVTIPKD